MSSNKDVVSDVFVDNNGITHELWSKRVVDIQIGESIYYGGRLSTVHQRTGSRISNNIQFNLGKLDNWWTTAFSDKDMLFVTVDTYVF